MKYLRYSPIVLVAVVASWVGVTLSAKPVVVLQRHEASQYLPGVPDYAIRGTFKTENLTVEKQAVVGPGGIPSFRRMQINGSLTTDEEMLWVEDDTAGHVGTGGTNQAISIVARQAGTTDTTAGNATASGLDVAVTQTKSAGGNTLTNTAILSNATGGDTNYSFFSSHGLMVQTDLAAFGNITTTQINDSGTATIAGAFTATSTSTLGPAGAGAATTVNGTVDIRSSNVDSWVSVQSTATGGRKFYIESSGDGGTQPDSLNIFDNTAGVVRWYLTNSGDVHVVNNEVVGGTGSFGGALNMNSHLVNNVTDPVSNQDAATKNYVDTHSSVISGLTTNTIPKATSSSTIGNSSVTDDATTFAIATNKFTVTEASGNFAAAGTASIGGAMNMNSHLINNVTDPSSNQDAATKNYVDTHVPTISGTNNTLTKFTSASTIGNSSITDNGTTVTFSTNIAGGTHTLSGITDFTDTGNTILGDASTDTLTINATTTHVAPTKTAGTSTTAITPAAVTGTQNNWNPTGIGTADIIYIATSGTTTITGLVAAQCTNGRTITLVNLSANLVSLPHASGSSTRPFHNAGGFTWNLYPNNDWGHTNEISTITYRCSTTSNSWEQVGMANISLPALGVDGQAVFTGAVTLQVGAQPLTLQTNSHLLSNSGTATIACNGTGAAATCSSGSCTDLSGTITTNTNATTCTITFGQTYLTQPASCAVSLGTSSATPAYISARSVTAFTITFPSMSAGLVDYICTGH